MKRTAFILTALAVLALAGLVSCQKENTDARTGAKQVYKENDVIARIMEFKEQVEHYNGRPGSRDAIYVSVDEAIWNLEALFNYTYAYPELCYGQTVSIDTVLNLPLSSNDSVSVSDLAAFYGTMHAAVSAIYNSVTLPDKQFVVLDVEEGLHQTGCVLVRLNTLQGSVLEAPVTGHYEPPYMGPFPMGVSWWYCCNGGNSLGQHIGGLDAADTLGMVLNAELVPVAPNGGTYVYTSIMTKATNENVHYPFSHPLYPQLGPYCEFHKENPVYPDDYWLTWEQMNFHYFGERYLVTEVLPHVSPAIPLAHVLFFVQVEAYDDDLPPKIGHKTTARYGLRTLVGGNDRDRSVLAEDEP